MGDALIVLPREVALFFPERCYDSCSVMWTSAREVKRMWLFISIFPSIGWSHTFFRAKEGSIKMTSVLPWTWRVHFGFWGSPRFSHDHCAAGFSQQTVGGKALLCECLWISRQVQGWHESVLAWGTVSIEMKLWGPSGPRKHAGTQESSG